jgi:hypothetical protein
MRLRHYSIRTESSYCDWIKRFIHFHRMKWREELLANSEARIEAFLSDLFRYDVTAPAPRKGSNTPPAPTLNPDPAPQTDRVSSAVFFANSAPFRG